MKLLMHWCAGKGMTAHSARADTDMPGMSGPPAVTPASTGYVSSKVEGGDEHTDAGVQGELHEEHALSSHMSKAWAVLTADRRANKATDAGMQSKIPD